MHSAIEYMPIATWLTIVLRKKSCNFSTITTFKSPKSEKIEKQFRYNEKNCNHIYFVLKKIK